MGWGRFTTLVDGKVAAAAPEAAAAKERAAALEHGIRMSRVTTHGTATLTIRGDAATLMSIDHTTRVRAEHLLETMPEASCGQRQITALAEGVGARTPRVKVYLHLTADSPIARMEGHGPVTIDYVRHLTARLGADNLRVQPVIDLNQTVAVDAYEIPTRLREAVHLIHPGDVFPFAANTSRRMDPDHQHPYAEGGPTSTDNLGPLTRTHHRIKTHDDWECRQPFPGITIWRDPHGAHYLVDPTGTRRVTPAPSDRTPTRAEIHSTRLLLAYAG